MLTARLALAVTFAALSAGVATALAALGGPGALGTPTLDVRADTGPRLTRAEVVARLDSASERQPASFAGADLSGVDLSGLDFKQANLTGARLEHANL